MTRDEKFILVGMIGYRDHHTSSRAARKKALSRLIARGYVIVKRAKTHPAFGFNIHDLTPKGLAAAVRLARCMPRQYRRSDWWNPRPSKIDRRTDAYGYWVLAT